MNFFALAEATDLARRLVLLCRTNQAVAFALGEAWEKENGRLLVALMAAENRGRGKARKGTRGKARR